jgi:hypothetical protein
MNPEGTGLCWRCERRAVFHESGLKPRFECGEARAVGSCYMFMPTKPVAVGPIEGEKRPIFAGWLLAGRIQSHGLVADERLALKLIHLDDKQKRVSAVWTINPIKDNKFLRRSKP